MKVPKCLLPILLAIVVTLPGVTLRLFHFQLAPPMTALLSGMAILAASFLLLWACDAAQADISQALALAVVALIAVLPEYAVDMYFTWQAGQYPNSSYAHYAIANMTGANRLLIGCAWALIAGIFWVKTRQAVKLEAERRTEILFLGMATAYAFVIPLKGTLSWYDGLVFISLYVWYIKLASRRPCVECELEGPSQILMALPKARRRLVTALMFLFSAGVILANAEPFCEGLVATGKVLGINQFLLVQWLAPIASEAPEFTVAIMFALRGQAGIALGSLLSAKLNQWTLLVGTIPAVYGISSGSMAHPLPMDAFQMNEILLTAAQSLLAVMLLAALRLDLKGAILLFSLFMGQLIAPSLITGFSLKPLLSWNAGYIHLLFSMLYVVAAVAIWLRQPKQVKKLWEGSKLETAGHLPAGKDLARSN